MNKDHIQFMPCFATSAEGEAGETLPHPVLSGNGVLVTGFGPTGYHSDEPIAPMQVFCLAGRRLRGPTLPLVRFGQLCRSLELAGELYSGGRAQQELSPSDGVVRSTIDHSGLVEQTLSFVCLTENSAAFRTVLSNQRPQPVRGSFAVRYAFGDWNGASPDGNYSVELRPEQGMAALHFEVEQSHLGRVELLTDPPDRSAELGSGFSFEWDFDLEPGQSRTWDLLWGIGDKLSFRYTPASWSFDSLLNEQREGWQQFHAVSDVSTGVEQIDRLREMCLYDLRCNSTPWSIPPLVSPSQWEARTFHDELYPYLGLASSGHIDRAGRIPANRLATLPKAIARSANRGAKFAWESTEHGDDGSPYGPWLEEHFHMGQFAECAWHQCLYDGRAHTLRRYYPLLSEIAEYYRLNLIQEDDSGACVRACTDYDEAIFPVSNGLYTLCAAIRSLELAASAADALGEEDHRTDEWSRLAAALRSGMPASADGARYLTAKGAKHRHVAEVGPVFPFRVDPTSDKARHTIDTFCEAVRTEMGLQPGNLPNYGGARWMWTTTHVSTAYSILGEPERAFSALLDAPLATAPGLVPCEHVSREGNAGLPFFTTAAGAFLYALHSMFVQISDDGSIRLPLLPQALANASFSGMAGVAGVSVGAQYRSGRCVKLVLRSPRPQQIVMVAAAGAFAGSIWDWPAVQQYSLQDDEVFLALDLPDGEVTWEP